MSRNIRFGVGVERAYREIRSALEELGLDQAPALLSPDIEDCTLRELCYSGGWLDHWMAHAERLSVALTGLRLWSVDYIFLPEGRGRKEIILQMLLAEDAEESRLPIAGPSDLPKPLRQLIVRSGIVDGLERQPAGYVLVPAIGAFDIRRAPQPGDRLALNDQSIGLLKELVSMRSELVPAVEAALSGIPEPDRHC